MPSKQLADRGRQAKRLQLPLARPNPTGIPNPRFAGATHIHKHWADVERKMREFVPQDFALFLDSPPYSPAALEFNKDISTTFGLRQTPKSTPNSLGWSPFKQYLAAAKRDDHLAGLLWPDALDGARWKF